MKKNSKSKSIIKKIFVFLLCTVMLIVENSIVFAATNVTNPDVPIPINVTLSVDGTARWDVPSMTSPTTGETYAVKKIRLRLCKGTYQYNTTTALWFMTYSEYGSLKTVDQSEHEYSFSIGSEGYYYVAIQFQELGGSYSNWAVPGNTSGFETPVVPVGTDVNLTSVSKDDTSSGGGSSSSSGSSSGGPGVNTGSGATVVNNYYNTGTSNVVNNVTGGSSYPGSTNQGNATQSGTGFITDQHGTYYVQNNGTYIKDAWAEINGYYYKFNSHGYIRKNCWYFENTNNKWYYLDEQGRMVTGVLNYKGKFYYLKPEKGQYYGTMACNEELYINGYWYAYGSDGAMITNGYFNNHYYGPSGQRVN